MSGKILYATLLGGVATAAILCSAGSASAQQANFDISPQPLSAALAAFSEQSQMAVIFTPELAAAKISNGVSGSADVQLALNELLSGTGLSYRRDGSAFVILRATGPQSGSAAGDGADAGTVQALIVTAQKREEQIQDVPIAISAFTQTALEEQKIEGGFDLLKAIPNVTFSKNNFTSYNFSIRGIGTKAVSATTDPGVAVSFNNASLIQNRLFEQEYFDVERVEVLRGPQGTLYGRNATAGVINVISAKPDMDRFKGSIKGEVGNYQSKRIVAMLNAPLVEDKLAVRFAGSLTSRDGYDYNDTTKHAVNGRDLWSARLSLAFNPTERIRTSLVWERFNEDDNRSRTGKQLCKRDPGPESVGAAQIGSNELTHDLFAGVAFSQGCLPVSLYDDSAFETPNGFAIPFISTEVIMHTDIMSGYTTFLPPGLSAPQTTSGYESRGVIKPVDPYGGLLQSRNLRVINSVRDPIYRANADIIQLNLDVDISDALLFTSQTTYDKDQVYSFQDYNRFNTFPAFQDTSGWYTANCHRNPDTGQCLDPLERSPWAGLAPGGVYCDPQIGCTDTIAGFDISQAKSTQWLQEFRLQSDFDGPVNFSAGVNYTQFKVLVDYYVMFNLITAFAQVSPFNYQADITKCNLPSQGIFISPDAPVWDINDPAAGCPYIDPNPVESINGEGHNYFRSKNPYRLKSAAAFGELYWKLSDTLKLTAGLRYTDDRKTFTPVPSQLLLGTFVLAGGYVNRGYPEEPDIKQHWGEFTGRIGVDWKPELSFTDQTMVYAFYSRGYKGGGANPPQIGFTKESFWFKLTGSTEPCGCQYDTPFNQPTAQNSTPTFRPEFVNAFEVGSKNTLMGGGLVFNAGAFFYDYKDYQVSKIVDRTAVNENFDSKVWGLEFEAIFSPTRNLRLIGNLGYLDTDIGKGQSIDIMNRTQGNPDWMVVRPWVQYPSNCILPKAIVEQWALPLEGNLGGFHGLCGSGFQKVGNTPLAIDPATGQPWNPLAVGPDGKLLYPDINGGAGFAQDLEGHELPNSPHWTANLGAQYGFEFLDGWKATIRGDAYWQSQSWARVYNAVNDKLHGWYNANLSLWIENDDGLKIELYAKNLLDKTPITDSFINSDDTALTTNVFVLDPRLIGLSIRKEF